MLHLDLADLTCDLRCRQVAAPAHGPGGAEHTAEGTSNLRRDAQRAALPFRDEHRLDGLTIRQRPEEFLGPVRRYLVGGDRQSSQRERLVERLTQGGGEVGRVCPTS